MAEGSKTLTDRIADFLNPSAEELAVTRAMMERFRPASFYGLKGPTLNFDEEIMQDTPGAPNLALAPNAKNLPQFLSLLRKEIGKNLTATRAERLPDVINDLANAFMRVRYPRYAKQVPIGEATKMGSVLEGALGKYFPRTGEIDPEIFIQDNPDSIQQAVSVLSHELRHARQGVKGEKFLNYVPYSRDAKAYLNQPVEVQARQAGNVALNAYRKFSKLMRDKYGDKAEGVMTTIMDDYLMGKVLE